MKTNNKTIKKIILLASFLLVMNSCDSFVDVNLPKSQLTNAAVFEDYSTADAALTDIYSKIRDRGMLTGTRSGISCQLGNYTDEVTAFGSASNTSWNFYNNTLLASLSDITEYWNSTYNQIYAANSIIENSKASVSLSDENKKKLLGEALFIRALAHFYLVNMFGEIPYIKQTDYKENSIVKRTDMSQVYDNIAADLSKAVSLLPSQYSSATRVRPNRFTAKALLARVYLYNGKYPEASNEASSILNETGTFSLTANLSQVFLINSKEIIWQLNPAAAGQNTKEGTTFILTSGPPAMSALNNDLVNSFAAADLRRSSWIKSVASGTSTWFFAYKYKERASTSTSVEYSVLFRLAEQYLIRAEARAMQGDLIGAKEDLNLIRSRAGLPNTSAADKEQIINAVLQERRWELFTEQGHRFFDLKRLKKLDSVLSLIKPGWNTEDGLLPIPQNEFITNPNLGSQNPGY